MLFAFFKINHPPLQEGFHTTAVELLILRAHRMIWLIKKSLISWWQNVVRFSSMDSVWSRICRAYATGLPQPLHWQGGECEIWSALYVQIQANQCFKAHLQKKKKRASSVEEDSAYCSVTTGVSAWYGDIFLKSDWFFRSEVTYNLDAGCHQLTER